MLHGLDALGDGADAQRLGERDDRRQDGAALTTGDLLGGDALRDLAVHQLGKLSGSASLHAGPHD